jgi:general secretion pathway protein E
LAVLAQRLVRRLCPECRQPYIPTDQDLRSLELDPLSFGPPPAVLTGGGPPDSVPPPPRKGKSGASSPAGTEKSNGAAANGGENGQHEHAELSEVGEWAVGTAALLNDVGATPNGKPPRPVFYRPTGCEQCAGTGYRGRVGIYELLVVEEPVRREILNNSDSKTITRVAAERGMVTLRVDGTRQVLAGRTSVEEVLAMTQAGDLE